MPITTASSTADDLTTVLTTSVSTQILQTTRSMSTSLNTSTQPTCEDGYVDENGTYVDCGGPNCPECPEFSSCTAKNIVNNLKYVDENGAPDSCVAFRAICDPSDTDSLFFNALEFHYCFLRKTPGISVLLLLAMIFFWFYLLGSTAEDFFCPALEELSTTMRMSANIAGATLLAFGNGAPDVFSNVASFSSGNADLGLSGLLGAGIFVTTIVVGAVAFVSNPTINGAAFLRDVAFYIISTSVLLVYYRDAKIEVWEAALFPVLYFVYVGTVGIADLKCVKEKLKDCRKRLVFYAFFSFL